MDVRLASYYRSWMVWLLPLTAGAGTLWLWLRAPRHIGPAGIRLRNGHVVDWRNTPRVNVVKDQFFEDEHGVIRLDLETNDGVLSLDMKYFESGQDLVQTIPDGFKHSRRAPSEVPINSVVPAA